ncbi:SH3 domain-containing protein [Almyronema epifaneia]|uniref:SH3 domain-containing protein n=1 Tax=Almyronema epifaneia S1 TaxID=2991925 RepID=A0ABW6IBE9_9CYAN
MRSFLLSLTKLIIGIALALVLLSLAGVATARYFMSRLADLPEKPLYENDAGLTSPEATAESASTASTATITSTAAPEADPPAEELPPNSYKALVVQPIGLVLREGPGLNYTQLGGVENNEEVIVLSTSDDQQWLQVRLPRNGQEGWVKAGNTRQIETDSEAENALN